MAYAFIAYLISTLKEIGLAMINTTTRVHPRVDDIVAVAKKQTNC